MRPDNQPKLVADFQFIFVNLTQLGQDPNAMIDCSEVIPAPKPLLGDGQSFLPAGKTMNDIEQAVCRWSSREMLWPLTTCFYAVR